jgi:hypothetical protein
MKTKVFLRIASVLTLIHAILHTVGGVFGKIPSGSAEQAVAAMKSNQFAAMGHVRTLWEFYMGMGLAVSVFLTIEAVVFWMLASLANSIGAKLRPVILVFAVGYLALAVNSYLYFFAAPVVVEILIAACLVMAAASAREPVRI